MNDKENFFLDEKIESINSRKFEAKKDPAKKRKRSRFLPYKKSRSIGIFQYRVLYQKLKIIGCTCFSDTMVRLATKKFIIKFDIHFEVVTKKRAILTIVLLIAVANEYIDYGASESQRNGYAVAYVDNAVIRAKFGLAIGHNVALKNVSKGHAEEQSKETYSAISCVISGKTPGKLLGNDDVCVFGANFSPTNSKVSPNVFLRFSSSVKKASVR
uniref:Uncharacterized protein n=1 Tax=Romanomermis culicivorax TaxID=13658 RepID=A0A915JXZ5_ROMCU